MWESLHCDTSVDHCPGSGEIVLQQVSVVVLQRVMFFVKSKQQILREEKGLKDSVALQQQIQRSEKKCVKKIKISSPAEI